MDTITYQKLETYFEHYKNTHIIYKGFIRRIRTGDNGNIIFIDIFDGTHINDTKCLVLKNDYINSYEIAHKNENENENENEKSIEEIKKYQLLNFDEIISTKELSPGCSIYIFGKVLESPSNTNQKFELQINALYRIGNVYEPSTFPIQKSNQKNFLALRNMPFMRVQTQLTQALFRIRSQLLFSIHKFFNDENVPLLDPNIMTMSDCEGAGETFTISPSMFSKDKEGNFINVGLTVSSQLPLEALAIGFQSVYTCQKSFRAEKSDTNKHLAEFLHIEYETYFTDLTQLLDFTERYLRTIILSTLKKCQNEYDFLNSKLAPEETRNNQEFLYNLINTPFKRITYTNAIQEIQDDLKNKVQHNGKRLKMKTFPKYGADLETEHEKYLVEKYNTIVIVTHWPKSIKSFYMLQNDENEELCDSFDILTPRVGELFGGSMRECSYDILKKEMQKRNMNENMLNWYVQLRQNGSAPHGGWGMGFDRLLMLMTGVPSVRDIVPFPVYYGHCPY